MPLGTRHDFIGMLLHRDGQLVLLPEAGGEWRLDVPRHAHRLAGYRVRITGVRDGFDLLAVQTIARI